MNHFFTVIQSSFFKHVSTLFIGTVAAQLINVIGLFVLARIYGTQEFAALALFSAIALIILSFSTLKLNLAIIKYSELTKRLALCNLAFRSNFVISIFAFIMLGVWNYFTHKIDYEFLSLFLVYLLSYGSAQCLISFFNSENNYWPIAKARILLASANFLMALALSYIYPSMGLVWAFTLASAISCIYLVYVFRDKILQVYEVKEKNLKMVLKENKDFIWFLTPATMLDVLSVQVIVIFFSNTFSEEIVGSYFMATKVVMLPTAFIGAAIGQVFFKDISTKYERNQLTKNDFWKIWKVLFGLGIIPFTILYFHGDWIFGFLLGKEWILAGQMATILAIKGFLNFIGSSTSSGFIVLRKQHYTFMLTIIRVIYTFILLIWMYFEKDIFLFLWYYVLFEVVFMIVYNALIISVLHFKTSS